MDLTNRKVLIADDDQDILEQLHIMLSRAGMEVIQAQGGKEAEELLADFQPDIAVIDLMMEHMDSGFVLCHHIKKRYPGTPVIILTAVTADTGLELHAVTAEERAWVRADAVMDKPVLSEQLLNQIKLLLNG